MKKPAFTGILAGLAAAALLSGCATQVESPELAFWVRPGVRAVLPQHPCGGDMMENAILTAKRDGRTERILTVRACRRGVMSLDVMTLTGMALLSVTYDGSELVTTNYVPLPQELRGEQIVADILMGTLPAEAWTTLPAGYHLIFEGNSRRLVDDDGKVVESFTYAEGPDGPRLARLSHEAFGYTIGFRYLEDPKVSDSTQMPGTHEEKGQ